MRIFLLQLFLLVITSSCMGSINVIYNPDLKVIGHRGHVAKHADNTIEGFLSAVDLGIHGVEMDLAVSADRKVVVSHEPYMAAASVVTPAGKRISRSKEKDYNLYKMTYDSIKQYKVGLLRSPGFRDQAEKATYKPLLSEVFEEVEEHRKKKEIEPVTFYLEVKSKPSDYGIFQPHPEEFSELIMEVVREHEMESSIVIKSFDANFLNVLKQKYPEVRTSLLLYRTPWQEKLKLLNFKPDIISPEYKQLRRKEQVEELQALGLEVIPYTVNSKRKIARMINLGVDAIITDYPERVLRLNKKSD